MPTEPKSLMHEPERSLSGEQPGRALAEVRLGLAHVVAETARLTGTTPRYVESICRSFLVAGAAGVAFLLAGLPLPWMLGPLTISLLLSVRGRPLVQPAALVHPVRTILGVAVGASFTPELLGKSGGALLSLSLQVPLTLAITAMSFVFLTRVARFDRPTAFFSAAPGGLADMVMYAQAAGADLRRVTLVQAARVLTIVFTLPFWLQFVGGMPLGGAMPKTLHLWELTLGDGAAIWLMAWGGWRLADRLGLSGGSVVGPMLVSALAHVAGLTVAKVPVELLILAQVTLGIVIGAQFRGISLSEFVTVLSWGLGLALMLLAVAGAMAFAVARLTGLDATSLLLSYAPGGQNEMAIIGLILGVDVAIIAMHHLLRVVIVVVGAQLVLQANPQWQGWKGEPAGALDTLCGSDKGKRRGLH